MYIRIKNNKIKLVFTILSIILLFSIVASVSASDKLENSSNSNNKIENNIKSISTSKVALNNENFVISKAKKVLVKSPNSKNKIVTPIKTKKGKFIEDGCSSIVLQVNKTNSVVAYRRDSTYAATLYLKKT
ncbi:MAG: hypothetical protein ACRC1M_03500, partial [Methanobacteriaceae archaeon]